MQRYLSERVKNLATSQTLAMAAKARDLRASGKDVIGLSLGEPDFNIPDFIKVAAKKAIDDNYNSYTPVDGYADLKQAIINKFERDNGLKFTSSQIVVSTGAKQALYNIRFVSQDFLRELHPGSHARPKRRSPFTNIQLGTTTT